MEKPDKVDCTSWNEQRLEKEATAPPADLIPTLCTSLILGAPHTSIVNWSRCPVNWSSNNILSREKPAEARRHQFPADLIPTLHSTQCALHISLISKTIHSQLVPLSNKLVIYIIKHWVSLSGSVDNISMLHTTFGLFLCCNIMVEIWYDFHAYGVQRLPL